MSIPGDDQIAVKDGDVIGIHYEQESGVLLNERPGSDAEVCCGFTFDQLNRNYNEQWTDDVIGVGNTIPDEMVSYRRMVAIKPIVGNVPTQWRMMMCGSF